MMRKFHKLWGDRGVLRQHHAGEELYGGYTSLLNHHVMIKPEKQSKKNMKQSRVAPHGCLGVYVGQERQKFVIKIEHVNHPRFRALLEDSEDDYGNSVHNNGPIYLPCNVDVFYEALAEITIADFDSPVSDKISSSYRSAKHSCARRISRFRELLTLI
ncbi:hypothetical protein QN277_005869 [Acacia crassicarpa]|uniref:Small auxin up regulated protein n=1 Tax=Acacia crassicarpa TaxID=499986 RepID=A0AAE1IZ14_9FABA|nr:hypothetical protein QN277_005869 [Acacia crassicarpa]